MRRMVYETRRVSRPSAELEHALLRHGPEMLAAAAGSPLSVDTVDGSFGIDLPSHWAGVDFAKRVDMTLGVARRMAGRLLLPIAWKGHPARHLFPAFEGTLEVEAIARDLSEITLAGSYGVPLGPLGAALDSTVLHSAARDTAVRLMDALAVVLREARITEAQPTTSAPPSAPLHVRQVMTPDPLVVTEDTSLRAAARAMLSAGVSAVPVVADDGGLLGVLSERDLLIKEATRRYGFGKAIDHEFDVKESSTAGQVCTRPALVTTPEATIADVARQMLDHDVNRLVVVDDGAITGIVSRHDVLNALVREPADVQAAAELALAQLGAEGARVRVDADGALHVDGTVRLRSVASQVHDVLAAVEGVMSVDTTGLRYAEDDVLPVVPMY